MYFKINSNLKQKHNRFTISKLKSKIPKTKREVNNKATKEIIMFEKLKLHLYLSI